MGNYDDLKADPLRWMLGVVESRIADLSPRSRTLTLTFARGSAQTWVNAAREAIAAPSQETERCAHASVRFTAEGIFCNGCNREIHRLAAPAAPRDPGDRCPPAPAPHRPGCINATPYGGGVDCRAAPAPLDACDHCKTLRPHGVLVPAGDGRMVCPEHSPAPAPSAAPDTEGA
jgi:hypothetical protein